MNHLKKTVFLTTLMAVLASSSIAEAANDGYRHSRSATRLAAGVAIGAVATIVLVAVLFQSSGGGFSSHNPGD